MRWIVLYLSTAAILVPLDIAFLALIGKGVFERNVPDMITTNPRMSAIILFYLIYIAGVVALVNDAAPADWRHNLLYGAILGAVAYATFELTNMAVLKHWEWNVVAIDIAWGTVLTAIAAAGGGLLAGWVLARIG